MMYNWTDLRETLTFQPISLAEVKGKVTQLEGLEGKTYSILEVTDKELTVDNDYVHPEPGAVFIVGDDLYGLLRILEGVRKAHVWNFKLLVYKLEKRLYSEPKSFARGNGG